MKTPSPRDDLRALGGYLPNLPQSIQYMILVWTAEQPGFDCADKPRFCENCPQANLDSDGGLSADKDSSAFILFVLRLLRRFCTTASKNLNAVYFS